MSTLHADSAQARELDKQHQDNAAYHDEAGAEKFAALCLANRLQVAAKSRANIKAALAKMEMICGDAK
ncbi:hypothetical protein [Pseudomonas phage PPpW-3]|uniref:Uncharacterized protein n=1 Tax=Pseudomonas phage PPpW-3 TaxID=1279082 RepID=V5YTK4_9CAUD|nr:hypothetical protein X916_gp48 [Pseudomonas phage PPpW-3]BAO20648.1 hypothetical protein [Pseudomonas phage PPpW-3]